VRHLTETEKTERSSTAMHTLANTLNMYIGIGIVTFPLSVARVGFYGAIAGFATVVFLNALSVYFLIKARNRYKQEKIGDLCDLAGAVFGPSMKTFCKGLIFLA